ncbi:bifunctional diaminohydroxyphosphoribosylaminopyrimidine deaminase/5-amino-6-(5-phosphoribosylamino)uracil reductase RibD [Robiginitalea sp.]|uniref:bifunctional diaminohydroxyphosphoribosylaminopyrimidine deaminase/5-amino-6-(5-phosphoribosylamino)uracil reductase RibD n=1 Tax=Robiginitalea sp. TaxID=1902411 RepID=UPI003C74FFA0
MKIHEKYLLRCLQIAENGLGSAAPNPMVGAVITYKDQIIGEGFTSPFGGAHAEVRAIDSVTDKSLLKKATLYVTLEPCCHFGKTPPCTDKILSAGIPKIVVGLKDPHEKVGGKGIAILRNAGCEVETGILKRRCEEHHRRFLTFHTKKRPFIILKWAQSIDGFMAPDPSKRKTSPGPYWISSPISRQLAHKWRSEEAGILVGTQTALQDNPRLDTRLWKGSSPVRILIDKGLRVPDHFHIFGPGGKTMVFCDKKNVPKAPGNVLYREVLEDKPLIPQLLRALWQADVQSLIVEGGALTLAEFIGSGNWDEARIITSPRALKQGLKAPSIATEPTANYKSGPDTVRILRNDSEYNL